MLDEGLGAGDARFAKRAQDRVKSLLQRAKILVIASHSEAMILELCNKAILLEQGRLISFGDAPDVVKIYSSMNQDFAEHAAG